MDDKPEIKANVLYYGDNLIHMQNKYNFPDNSVDLIYVDSQFAPNIYYVNEEEESQRNHKKVWENGIKSYIENMRPRLQEMQRILSERGTICIHCDYHASAHLRILMDEIFEYKNYQTTIVYQRTKGAFGQKSNKIFPEVSDYILVYSKGRDPLYNTIYSKYSKKIISEFKNPDNDPRGRYIWQRYSNGAIPPSETFKANEESKVKFLRKGRNGRWQYKRYLENTYIGEKFIEGKNTGTPIMNVWTDISKDLKKEFITQKPEELLERIILAFTNKDKENVVFDPFLGSGTTAVVAKKLGRKYIGIDYSMSAILMSAKRLGVLEKDIIGIPQISIKTTEVIKKINKENILNKDIALDIIKATEEFSIKRTKARDENDIHREYIGFLKGRFPDLDFDFKKPIENGKIPDISIKRIIGMELKRKTHYYSVGAQIFEYESSFEYLMFVMFDMIGSDKEYENMKFDVRKSHPEIIFIRDGVPS